MWEVDEPETNEVRLTLHDPEDWYKADVRWDGCVHFYQASNKPMSEQAFNLNNPDISYLHICYIDDLIKRLQDIQTKAKEHFGQDWPI